MGGSKAERVDKPSNLVTLCGSGTTGCHGYLESRRFIAERDGWILHAMEDPAHVPIMDKFGRRFALDDEGNLRYLAREEWQ